MLKSRFFGEWDTEFDHTSLHSVVGAEESWIPLNATVLHFVKGFGQRVANGESSSTVGDAVGEEYVLEVAHQVFRHKNGVVVPCHEPLHVLHPQPKRLQHDPRDPNL